jgi:hypothetical protein
VLREIMQVVNYISGRCPGGGDDAPPQGLATRKDTDPILTRRPGANLLLPPTGPAATLITRRRQARGCPSGQSAATRFEQA